MFINVLGQHVSVLTESSSGSSKKNRSLLRNVKMRCGIPNAYICKLLDDLKDRRGYCKLKEEALDRTMWRNRFGRGFGPVV